MQWLYSKCTLKNIVEYTYVDQNHHYIVRCINKNKDCI